ncbi:MAG TPA: ATP-binding protein [Bryobacteraceae bacterium]|nr:ATP-binding protein [Bryobacteraceae bacterium]
MDPVTNPYSPGTGSPPPELAGRDELREQVRISIARLKISKPSKSVIMVGLRGVGKTVLLDQLRKDATSNGILSVRIEAPEHRSLPALLAPQLRGALLKLSRVESAADMAKKGLKALAGFAKSLKVKYNDIEVGFDFDPEPGLADNGELEGDLASLLEQVGLAARSAKTAAVLFIDELQYIHEEQLAALISALHACSQASLPITVVGAGLPQLRGMAGQAKSYAERLFDFPMIGPLPAASAELAIVKPAREQQIEFEPDAVRAIISWTHGYPYFLQEWGKHAWEVATQSPITVADVQLASKTAIAALDESFFRVRFDRLTPAEKTYLRAMADLGPGPHRSGDIADRLGRSSQSLGPCRSSLIGKGMIWSPNYGDTAFTVPLFDEFMKRIIPEMTGLHRSEASGSPGSWCATKMVRNSVRPH